MKIGLPFLTQLQGSADAESTTGSGGSAPSFEQGGRSLGGWVAQTIRQLVSQIATGYHTQHNDDDSHKVITATGTISERGRATAMGVWISVPFAAGSFTVPTGSTWTVTQGQLIAFQYALVGTTMHVSFYIESSTLATAACSVLYIALPANVKSTRRVSNQFAYDDNGTKGTGVVQVRPVSGAMQAGVNLELMKDMRGSTNWGTSSGLSVFGEISFEIVAADTATPPNNTFIASGGTITTTGTKTIHTFSGSGTFMVAQGQATVDYLVVGGGGGGGNSSNQGVAGGAGGGGRVRTGSLVAVAGNYTVTIGAGGLGRGGDQAGNSGTQVGGDSVFGTVTSTGGGGGGNFSSAGQSGGNGGGGTPNTPTGSAGGIGTDHNGGAGFSGTVTGGAGGGGSTNGVGADGQANNGGAGANGTASSISGASVTYGGGGGGCGDVLSAGVGGAGGTGGGGTGGTGRPATGATAGGTNTGGGGGGTNNNNGAGLAPSGGSGIVIISYTTP